MSNDSKINIGLLTFHRAYNYGAVLQCYALKNFINENDIECHVIDYWPRLFKEIYYLKCKRTILHPHINYTIKKLKIYKLLKKRNKGFELFLKQYILDSNKSYTTREQLSEFNLSYTGYIVGSDQIWNDTCVGFDSVYFLDFPATLNKFKFAYAASLGREDIPQELTTQYYERLKKFDYITMREQSGAEAIKALLHKNIETVCDPTLLLDSFKWKKIANMDVVPYKQYILVYYVTEGDSVRKYAYKLSKKLNLPVVSIPCRIDYEGLKAFEDRKRKFTVLSDISPQQFIGLFSQASYVVTNSFHGTAFSVIFHKQFMSQYQLDSGGKNDRVMNLLQTLGIKDRLIDLDTINIDDKINWNIVDEKISIQREKAQHILFKMLSICRDNM